MLPGKFSQSLPTSHNSRINGRVFRGSIDRVAIELQANSNLLAIVAGPLEMETRKQASHDTESVEDEQNLTICETIGPDGTKCGLQSFKLQSAGYKST